MNLTFGFIAFFIAVIIPGILFRRFFYYGEFSKQFDSKDPVLHSIFYSIVPGVCIQVICFVMADAFFSFNVENEQIFNVFKDFVYSGEKDINDNTKKFLNSDLDTFIYYSLVIFLVSIVAGHLFSRLIRWFALDKKFKILKFKNQWFYIFSGELLQFEKFEFGRNITTNEVEPHNHKISTTYADVLVDNTEGMRELYSGYVVDYDLKADDLSQLERLYLLDAYRYKRIEKEAQNKVTTETAEESTDQSEEEQIQIQLDYKSRLRKKIPGNVFIVGGKDILNINLTYVPSEKKKALRETTKQNRYRYIDNIYMLVTLGIILLHFIFRWVGLNETWFEEYIKNSSIFVKLIVILTSIQFFALFNPSYSSKTKKYKYSFSEVVYRLLVFAVFYFSLCGLQCWEYLPKSFPLLNPFC